MKSDSIFQYSEIFVPGGDPEHTYNSRASLHLEERIISVKNNLCKLVVVTGHTKSGKTVLVRNVLPRSENIWVDGGDISSEEDFWTTIIDWLNLSQEVQSSNSNQVQSELSGEITAEGNVFVAKGGVKIGSKIMSVSGDAISSTRHISSKMIALNGLRQRRVPLIVDDFHFLPSMMQQSIIRAFKALVFEGVPVVLIAIPHRRHDVFKVEREMTARTCSIDVPSWDPTELKYIPRTGFRMLGKEIPDHIIDMLVSESVGSPHLMQEFCKQICQLNVSITDSALNLIFYKTADDLVGRPMFEMLSHGPRSRRDRKPRRLKNGETVDIYKLILICLAYLRPGLVTLEYDELHKMTQAICVAGDVPTIQEIGRILKQMAKIANTDPSSTAVIDFDEGERKLHIADPFFAFYLRWGSFTAHDRLNHVFDGDEDTNVVAIVPAASIHTVDLGEYEDAGLIPAWDIDYDANVVSWKEIRVVMEDGAIRLHISLQNTGMQSSIVRIRDKDVG